MEFSTEKAGQDVTPMNLDFGEEKRRSSTLNSITGRWCNFYDFLVAFNTSITQKRITTPNEIFNNNNFSSGVITVTLFTVVLMFDLIVFFFWNVNEFDETSTLASDCPGKHI